MRVAVIEEVCTDEIPLHSRRDLWRQLQVGSNADKPREACARKILNILVSHA